MFQFLIGELQTYKRVMSFSVSTYVSIPHRRATNLELQVVQTEQIPVSIPHRRATNLRFARNATQK